MFFRCLSVSVQTAKMTDLDQIFRKCVQMERGTNGYILGVIGITAIMENAIFMNSYRTNIDSIMNPIVNGMFSWSRNQKYT